MRTHLSLLIGGLLLAAPARGGVLFTVTDLGTLGGGSSHGAALSSDGRAAGWSTTAGGGLQAISYDGSLTGLSGGAESQAHGVNALGEVAGTVYDAGVAQATVWRGGAAVSLGSLGGSGSYATAINNSGRIVGNAVDAAGTGRAFRTDGDTMAALDGLSTWRWSNALAVSEAGWAAGTAQTVGGAFRGVLWNEAGAVVAELGTLGGAHSYGMGMNDAGLVVGSSTTATGWLHAFLYTGGTLIDLGTLGGGNSGAYDVNDLGWIVGYSHTASGGTAAFLYAGGILYDLNALIGNAGWILEEALAVNNSGQIVGTGVFGGERHGFLLDPLSMADSTRVVANPEPGTMAMLLIGAGMLAGRVYWKRRRA